MIKVFPMVLGTMLALNGIALSGTFVPVYLILENIAQDRGYKYSEDSLKLVVGIWVNFAMAGMLLSLLPLVFVCQ